MIKYLIFSYILINSFYWCMVYKSPVIFKQYMAFSGSKHSHRMLGGNTRKVCESQDRIFAKRVDTL